MVRENTIYYLRNTKGDGDRFKFYFTEDNLYFNTKLLRLTNSIPCMFKYIYLDPAGTFVLDRNGEKILFSQNIDVFNIIINSESDNIRFEKVKEAGKIIYKRVKQ